MVPELLPDDVRAFVKAHIDSVPHLEALLLIWDSPSRAWTLEEIAQRTYVPADRAERVLGELAARGWIRSEAGRFFFEASTPDAPTIAHLAEHYRSNLIRIAEIIHRKVPASVRDFARAFDLRKKDR